MEKKWVYVAKAMQMIKFVYRVNFQMMSIISLSGVCLSSRNGGNKFQWHSRHVAYSTCCHRHTAKMSTLSRLNQTLKGKTVSNTLTTHLRENIYLAKSQLNQPARNHQKNPPLPHLRLENERDILKQFQGQTPFARPLLDDIVVERGPGDAHPPANVLRYWNNHLLNAMRGRRCNARGFWRRCVYCMRWDLCILVYPFYIYPVVVCIQIDGDRYQTR